MSMLKKSLFGLALVLCASLAFADSVRVTASKANLRSAPNATAKVLRSVPQGTMLDLVETSGVWMKVKSGAVVGWIHSTLVEQMAEAKPASPPPSASASSSSYGRSSKRRASASADEKRFNFGLGVSLESDDVGFGFDGRALITPSPSMPALRIVVALDVFPKTGTPMNITGNAIYQLRDLHQELKPYVGAGIVHSRSSVNGETFSSTDLDIAGGVEFKGRFFGELRVVLSEGSPMILSAGVRF